MPKSKALPTPQSIEKLKDEDVPKPVRRGDRPEWAGKSVDDPHGKAWHAEARTRWGEAEKTGDPLRVWVAPEFPDWQASRPAHVTRELLGRFLQDRDTRVVHDVYHSTPECGVDAIRNGTFFHFWSEVVADTGVVDDLPCPHCLAP